MVAALFRISSVNFSLVDFPVSVQFSQEKGPVPGEI